ncbi:MAG TPA: M13 family metallopeptidase [Phenylobacterium sp.]|jgi:predicted metalloendopeptidase|uniref:M13 family metallopeptidase n=1 Tax=Phenylobacterium sp. TaxID=1871053 RepID=UPI002D358011|nr:M13 family metallopeptidase [Phenylobacterium sp.]HZZ67555.1 M13 family metallopeptidase [Phenylobacterium sp.]
MKRTQALLALSAAFVLAAMAASAQTAAPSLVNTHPAGLDLAGMDRNVKPGDDFFAYANGHWLATTEIPADRSSWGVGAELTELTTARTQALIQGAAKAKPGTEARKIGDYYLAYLDEKKIEALGLKPLQPTLVRIAAVKDKTALAAEFGRELRADVDALNSTNFYTDHLFGLWVEQDLNDPKRYAPYLLQGGLGMPDRDFYLSDSARMAKIRDAYKAHIAKVLTLAGHKDAQGEAQKIFDLETMIAKAHAPRGESEDVLKANNPWAMADFAKKAPGLDWSAFFAAAGLQARPQFIVWHPQATVGEAALVASQPLAVWKSYLTYLEINHYSGVLPKAFADERFAFYGTTLSGTPQQQARWKRAVNATNGALGMAVGKLYVAKYFPPEAKAKVQAMVADLIAAFRVRIEKLDWMAPATKAEALRKLATLKVGVGYPDHWIDYSALKVVPGDALGNVQRAELFEYHRNLAKFGRPVDRGEWAMTPQLVNAVNLPVRNALNFPAAILQAPYFDVRNPVAMNLGGTGATIGHEISHSFDDQGAMFNADGQLKNWWTPADLAHFQASGKALARQFDQYHAFPDLPLKGEQELSENIADIAGLNAAYDAYRLANGGKEGPSQQGFTGDQQFFIAFAQSWRAKFREALIRQIVVTDGHALDEFRADTVRNMDAWYPALDVNPGEKLYLAPADRVRIW